MTDTTNHAEVIREALEHFKRNAFDGYGYEMPGPAGKALTALDALTREAQSLSGRNHYLESRHIEMQQGWDACRALADLRSATIAAQAERIKALEEERIGMAKLLIQVRDEIIKDDYQEAYHLVYVFAESIASDLYKPWAELEARAALAPKEAQG